jgi:hypothetical protein
MMRIELNIVPLKDEPDLGTLGAGMIMVKYEDFID